MKSTEAPIVVTSQIEAAVADVWKAISQKFLMVEWYFTAIPDFKAEVGFETSFEVENEGRIFTHNWKVVNVIPEQELSYKWSYDEYPGDSIVHFYLEPKGSVTLITVKAVVLEDFPDDIPEFRRESCEGGWDYFIPGKLKSFLERT